ncbi:DUF4091 domain-containing protein [Paenibacillus solisilvae]|uniref:DUF4091 domain-containing protein n=1 Tax=Paenibacillus solisilvae TaxID=2486751 RepID=A0ABW0W7I5_9BACL
MTQTSPAFETICLSSLSKVFADAELCDSAITAGTALWKEVYTFQVAYRSQHLIKGLQVEAQSQLLPYITIRSVGLSPSELPVYSDPDVKYSKTHPGLFPDPLYPLAEGLHALPNQWRAIWITVALPSLQASESAGVEASSRFTIDVKLSDDAGNKLGEECFTLEVLPAELPDQKLIHTEWFHCDCLATQYGVEVFSEEHWQLIERYISNAADHGVNMLLTPLFTPPLDTAVGGERPTVQLIHVEQIGEDLYRFGFDRLERWARICGKYGVTFLEFSHLFTQWGAHHAPKVIAMAEGSEKQIFGWETDAAGEPYRAFLDQFLPELVRFIKAHGLEKQVYFHVSDEPQIHQLEQYRQASDYLRKHLGEFRFLDALSDYEFYEHGLVEIPIPANDHIDPFIEQGVEPLWTYYCCAQNREVSNRFFSMPSSRNRVLGVQLYKFGIQGFLHWGYNFWYTQGSTRAIDPFKVTDSDRAFASGDPFVVYPGADGPIDSIRWEVFREALQDQRAMELLETLAGRGKVLELLEEGLDEPLSFKTYPIDLNWLLSTRERMNKAIKEALSIK